MLHVNEWSKFAQDKARYCPEIFLSLEEALEASKIGFEPILFVVLPSRILKISDHLVHVILEVRDFACGLNRDRSREISLRNRRCYFRHGSDLSRKRCSESVYIVCQI